MSASRAAAVAGTWPRCRAPTRVRAAGLQLNLALRRGQNAECRMHGADCSPMDTDIDIDKRRGACGFDLTVSYRVLRAVLFFGLSWRRSAHSRRKRCDVAGQSMVAHRSGTSTSSSFSSLALTEKTTCLQPAGSVVLATVSTSCTMLIASRSVRLTGARKSV